VAITSGFIIETQLVHLRPLCLHDLAPLHETVMADADVMRYIGSGRTSTREEARRFLERVIGRYPESDFGWYAMEPAAGVTGLPAFCGVACLKPLAGDLLAALGEHIEVGYWLAKAAWGRGVATAAASALVRRGFVDLGVPEIVGVAHTENTASNRVLQKAGLRHRQSVTVCDWPLQLYSRTRLDYLAGGAGTQTSDSSCEQNHAGAALVAGTNKSGQYDT
jgi:RimJ/RimL family protein N-acetyltransferase